MSQAKAAMRVHYESEGFDPAAFMKSLGVLSDLAVWRESA